MRFHAEKIKSIGAGLLSESNHGLKNSISDTNRILDEIASGLHERVGGENPDPAAFIEDQLLPQVVQFMAVKLKKQFPDINDNKIGDYILNGLKQAGHMMGTLKVKSRTASKQSGSVGRQIKRGM